MRTCVGIHFDGRASAILSDLLTDPLTDPSNLLWQTASRDPLFVASIPHFPLLLGRGDEVTKMA